MPIIVTGGGGANAQGSRDFVDAMSQQQRIALAGKEQKSRDAARADLNFARLQSNAMDMHQFEQQHALNQARVEEEILTQQARRADFEASQKLAEQQIETEEEQRNAQSLLEAQTLPGLNRIQRMAYPLLDPEAQVNLRVEGAKRARRNRLDVSWGRLQERVAAEDEERANEIGERRAALKDPSTSIEDVSMWKQEYSDLNDEYAEKDEYLAKVNFMAELPTKYPQNEMAQEIGRMAGDPYAEIDMDELMKKAQYIDAFERLRAAGMPSPVINAATKAGLKASEQQPQPSSADPGMATSAPQDQQGPQPMESVLHGAGAPFKPTTFNSVGDMDIRHREHVFNAAQSYFLELNDPNGPDLHESVIADKMKELLRSMGVEYDAEFDRLFKMWRDKGRGKSKPRQRKSGRMH